MNRLSRALCEVDLFLNPKFPRASASPPGRLLRACAARVRGPVLNHLIRQDRARAAQILSALPELSEIHADYTHQTRSTGVEVSDYVRLYIAVRTLRPVSVLECGTGLSTTAIAYALHCNDRDYGDAGHVISMEESPEWYEEAIRCLPHLVADYVRIVLSPRVDREHHRLRGVCYAAIPDEPYEFVFVDGPVHESPTTGDKLFDMDFAFVAERIPSVQGLVDHRLDTILGLRRAVKKTHHVTYNPNRQTWVSLSPQTESVGEIIAFDLRIRLWRAPSSFSLYCLRRRFPAGEKESTMFHEDPTSGSGCDPSNGGWI